MHHTQPISASALLTCLIALSISICGANTVIANSQLQSCIADSQGRTSVLTCKQQLVTTIAVTNNGGLATQSLNYQVPCIQSTDGACPCTCNYATDAVCTCRDLAQSINVTLTKTPVYATYPLTYQQAFNYKPYEAVILTGAGNTVHSCSAGALASTPTCGWALDSLGRQIYNSQGFCCSCSLSQVSAATLGNGYTTATRATLNCDLAVSWIYGAPGSASCLRFDPLYYQGYAVGSSQMSFAITVNVSTITAGANGQPSTTTTQAMVLSPSTPSGLSTGKLVYAQLLGDLAGYQTAPSFEYSYLMIPQYPGASANAALTSNFSSWMMIPQSQVSLDGSTCNKVGTSYTAFETQPNACSQPVGSCLANQIADLAAADDKLIALGSTPLYYVTRWGGGNAAANQAFSKVQGGPLWFGLPITQILNSVVTLNVAADSLTLVTNQSPGLVLSAVLCTFNNASCGSFVALNQHGYVHVVFQNTGYIDASYTVELTNCSTGFLPVLAQQFTVAAQDTQNADFEIYAATTTAQATNVCSVQLLDSGGDVTDMLQFGFSVNATVYSATPNQSNLTGVTGPNAPASAKQSLTCSQICGRLNSFVCDIKYRCWDDLLEFGLIMLATIALAIFLYVGLMRGWWFTILGKFLGFLCSRGKRSRKGRHRLSQEEDSAEHGSRASGADLSKAVAKKLAPAMTALKQQMEELQAKVVKAADNDATAASFAAAMQRKTAAAAIAPPVSQDSLQAQQSFLPAHRGFPDKLASFHRFLSGSAATASGDLEGAEQDESAAESSHEDADAEEAALNLVEQAQSNNGAYLNLRSVALQPPDLVISAGPSACLHGWLDLPPTPSEGALMVRFRLHANRSQQLKAWNSSTKAYAALPMPRAMDARRFSVVLQAQYAVKLFTLGSQGICLN
ncbi:hypothetical protein WJX73_004741 [Symbiochloris irregularis]|uniref:Generative cell specific-1/HAP2 domain-containing protein n=1 Tax=Symbiochloris irregularis TaxID=706552 RepID=A0AAW1NZZ5_9CHLO